MAAVPDLDVLRCPACGADVPRGDAGETRCRHCGKAVPLPEEERAYLDVQQQDEAGRRRAQALFATLDSPPWLATRIFAAVFDQPMLAFWLYFGAPVGLVSIAAGLAVDAHFHPPPAATVGVVFAALFVFAFVPRAAGIYSNARAGGRRVLLAGLAAKPPILPGGPAGCRGCGAPLSVPKGALVARCHYCGVESAVAIRTPFLSRVRKAARATARTIGEAIATDRVERAAIRLALARELRRYLLTTATFGALFAVWAWDYQRSVDRGDDSAPGLGIAALVVGTLLLIALMFRSGRSDPREAEGARQRRDSNGVPGWVRIAGPIGFWALLWIVRLVVWG